MSRRAAPYRIVLVVDFKGFYPVERASTAVTENRAAIKTAAFQGTSITWAIGYQL